MIHSAHAVGEARFGRGTRRTQAGRHSRRRRRRSGGSYASMTRAVGDIVVEDGDIFGDGVNVAVRLEGLAEPGGICVSVRVYRVTTHRKAEIRCS
jgi:hypothetical protein